MFRAWPESVWPYDDAGDWFGAQSGYPTAYTHPAFYPSSQTQQPAYGRRAAVDPRTMRHARRSPAHGSEEPEPMEPASPPRQRPSHAPRHDASLRQQRAAVEEQLRRAQQEQQQQHRRGAQPTTRGTVPMQADAPGRPAAAPARDPAAAPAPARARSQAVDPARAALTVQKWWRGWRLSKHRAALKALAGVASELQTASSRFQRYLNDTAGNITERQLLEVNEMAMRSIFKLDSLEGLPTELRALRKNLTARALRLQDDVHAAYNRSSAKPGSPAAIAAAAAATASAAASAAAAAAAAAAVAAATAEQAAAASAQAGPMVTEKESVEEEEGAYEDDWEQAEEEDEEAAAAAKAAAFCADVDMAAAESDCSDEDDWRSCDTDGPAPSDDLPCGPCPSPLAAAAMHPCPPAPTKAAGLRSWRVPMPLSSQSEYESEPESMSEEELPPAFLSAPASPPSWRLPMALPTQQGHPTAAGPRRSWFRTSKAQAHASAGKQGSGRSSGRLHSSGSGCGQPSCFGLGLASPSAAAAAKSAGRSGAGAGGKGSAAADASWQRGWW
ncbi:hypothetical protein HYH03_003589 [Edaphochlamys debaryana]|uniref:BAG domain-containing protein n=1 Tax=Edaphochlamys debaryana TaxID=47281 RepID=A0A835YAV9_9CHLO|nr:hypothetical protein HYH03_003589 [Edaphochlamys debaryana]|eukprot:KAG2498329.1 hypothetical protein HYH03_003589 [Edaphochlamys debaryana]